MGHYPRGAKIRVLDQLKRKNLLQWAKLKQKSYLSFWVSGIELQDLKFALLGFEVALVQYFVTITPVYSVSLFV